MSKDIFRKLCFHITEIPESPVHKGTWLLCYFCLGFVGIACDRILVDVKCFFHRKTENSAMVFFQLWLQSKSSQT